MKKKTKGTQNKVQAGGLITEHERNKNPIFRAIYNRIRNLNKKLANIDSLQQIQKEKLKPEQVEKIEKRPSIQAQISRNEGFAQFYKDILTDNGGVAFDCSQQIMKVATLLAVGAHMQHKGLADMDKVYKPVADRYLAITANKWPQNSSIPDLTAQIFGIITSFLNDHSLYKNCQDYISYLPEQLDQNFQHTTNQQQLTPAHCNHKNHSKLSCQKVVDEHLTPEIQKLQQINQAPKQAATSQKSQLSERDSGKSCQKLEPQPQLQSKEAVNKRQGGHSKEDNIEKLPKDNKREKNRTNPPSRQQVNRYKQKSYQRGQAEGNRQRRYNGHKYENRQAYRQNNFDNQKTASKKQLKWQGNSDSSLEATPEKNTGNKPKYIEKK